MRVIDLMLKDLRQLLRDWKTAFFLVIMPVIFTLLFGFAFGGFGGEATDPRLPVGYLDQDGGLLSGPLQSLLAASQVIRLEQSESAMDPLREAVSDERLAAALIIPAGFSQGLLDGNPVPVQVIADGAASAGRTAQGELEGAIQRLASAVDAAKISTRALQAQGGVGDQAQFERVLDQAVAHWQSPPIGVQITQAVIETEQDAVYGSNAFSHSSPGMMAQFAIAALMGAASILVLERKSRALQRLLTTNMTRGQILAGHYLAMFLMIFVQIFLLMLFGQLLLRLNYLGQPIAGLLLAIASALFAASLGLLIGALAKSEEQVIVFSLVPMFILAGLGGAWLPLEFTPEVFQRIAYLTPVAWMVDGFKDLIVRGQGLEAVTPALGVLLGYAVILFALAARRFRFE